MQTVTKPSGSGVAGVPADPVRPEDLPLERAYHWERETPNAVFLTQPVAGQVRQWTWAQTLDEARRMAAWLSAQNWPEGSRVVILSKNSAWWMMAELAVWMSGHITVPLYASLSASSVHPLMQHCEPVACFLGVVDDKTIVSEGIPAGIQRITFPNATDPAAISWQHIIDTTSPMLASPVRDANDIATIIYTSGTTGAPKGAMHRFSAFAYFATAAIRTHNEHKGGRMLSYLPLAHIAERALVEAVALKNGAQLFFVESIDSFLEDIKRARPTVFFSVPRLYVKFQQKVLDKMPERKLDRLLRVPILRGYVQKKILTGLGLECTHLAASGGASLPLSTLLWFRKVGLPLVEGYGMTETGITHTPPNKRSKPGFVGDGIPGVETRIAEDGEVQVRSPMNTVGYFRNPQGTAECFTEDGFFKTGDLGELDEEGWLRIVGRVKEQFKTSKGKYVSPNRIEQLLTANASIEACCVMGAEMPHPFGIVTLGQELRSTLEQVAVRPSIEQQLEQLLTETNAQLEPHERLEFLVVTDQSWTIANGMLTPTMKLKRHLLERTYREMYDQWAAKKAPVIWHITPQQTATARQTSA